MAAKTTRKTLLRKLEKAAEKIAKKTILMIAFLDPQVWDM